jgi:cytochrome bd ubiquinol oxidase subunit II
MTMDAGNILQVVWYVLIGVLLAGYSVLDGLDLGIGALFPFLAKTREERDSLAGAVGPIWDGNEVWLLTGGGALFAAFPAAYATVFSGFYLALMLVLFSLIFRAVSLEFRAHASRGRRFWDHAFFLGSALPALLFGVALGNLVQGVPLNASGDFAGSFFTLLRPFPLVIGLFGLVAILLHGAAFAAVKTEGELQARARRTAGVLRYIYLALLVLSGVVAALTVPGLMAGIWGWISAAVVLGALVFMRAALAREKDGLVLLLSAVAFLGLWGIVGSDLYPNLVRASNDPALSLTLRNASSSPLTLKVMLVIALVGMPPVIGYSAYAYRVFKGKARPGY